MFYGDVASLTLFRFLIERLNNLHMHIRHDHPTLLFLDSGRLIIASLDGVAGISPLSSHSQGEVLDQTPFAASIDHNRVRMIGSFVVGLGPDGVVLHNLDTHVELAIPSPVLTTDLKFLEGCQYCDDSAVVVLRSSQNEFYAINMGNSTMARMKLDINENAEYSLHCVNGKDSVLTIIDPKVFSPPHAPLLTIRPRQFSLFGSTHSAQKYFLSPMTRSHTVKFDRYVSPCSRVVCFSMTFPYFHLILNNFKTSHAHAISSSLSSTPNPRDERRYF